MDSSRLVGADARDDVGLYVFCLARESGAEAASGHGLAERSALRVHVHGDIAAICCEVPLHEWTGEAGEAHLKDLSWLGPRALRHEEVIELMMRASPVLPLRFGCLFSSVERLEEMLRREHSRISAFIEKVAREEEWSLQGLLDLKTCEEAAFAADPRVAKLPASGGTRYLMEQKLRKDAARSARSWIQEAETMISAALEGLVLDRRILKPTPRVSESPALEGVFRWAILVPRGAEAELSRRLEPLAEKLVAQGLHVSARGPWPAYNFAPNLGAGLRDPREEESLG